MIINENAIIKTVSKKQIIDFLPHQGFKIGADFNLIKLYHCLKPNFRHLYQKLWKACVVFADELFYSKSQILGGKIEKNEGFRHR